MALEYFRNLDRVELEEDIYKSFPLSIFVSPNAKSLIRPCFFFFFCFFFLRKRTVKIITDSVMSQKNNNNKKRKTKNNTC